MQGGLPPYGYQTNQPAYMQLPQPPPYMHLVAPRCGEPPNSYDRHFPHSSPNNLPSFAVNPPWPQLGIPLTGGPSPHIAADAPYRCPPMPYLSSLGDSVRFRNDALLFVAGFGTTPPSEKGIWRVCREFGDIDTIKIKASKDGAVAIVRFESKEHARRAHSHGLSLAGRRLITRMGASDATIFVGHLDEWITDELLFGQARLFVVCVNVRVRVCVCMCMCVCVRVCV